MPYIKSESFRKPIAPEKIEVSYKYANQGSEQSIKISIEKQSKQPIDPKQKFHEIHSRFIQPLTDDVKEKWIDKIWTTQKLESHENEDPIEILYWFRSNGLRREKSDEIISFGENNSVCGPCKMTVDRDNEGFKTNISHRINNKVKNLLNLTWLI